MSTPRRSSIGMLLRRSKSGDLKKQAAKEQQLQREREASISKSPPRLPVLFNDPPAPQLQPFGGDHESPPRSSMEPGLSFASVPPPPIPNNGWDPYARTESMAHRGRYSYASSAVSTVNSPRRVRRRKDPTPFNILIIGTRGAGKTSFLEFLKMSLSLPAKKRTKSTVDDHGAPTPRPSGNFIPHYLETEIDGERVGLTLWDSEGLEQNIVDLQLRDMAGFLESRFEDTFSEEMKVVRSPGVQDTHIHAAFLVLDPARLDRNLAATKNTALVHGHHNGSKYPPPPRVVGSLDEDLDLQVLRTLQGKTTVIPVISKADTITIKHMAVLKKTVWDSLQLAKLDPLEVLGLEDEDDDASNEPSRIEGELEDPDVEDANGVLSSGEEGLPIQGADTPKSKRLSKRLSDGSDRRHKPSNTGEAVESELPYIPLSILSPDLYEPGVVGRKFPWGFADPYNEEHCDFVRLKESVFSDWRGELREASRERWYEGWRTSRLNRGTRAFRR